MEINSLTENLEHWCVAIAEMLFASITLNMIFGHVVTIFWAVVTTIVIYFTNRLLKKYFK